MQNCVWWEKLGVKSTYGRTSFYRRSLRFGVHVYSGINQRRWESTMGFLTTPLWGCYLLAISSVKAHQLAHSNIRHWCNFIYYVLNFKSHHFGVSLNVLTSSWHGRTAFVFFSLDLSDVCQFEVHSIHCVCKWCSFLLKP